jgi:hypothetical protein
MRIFWQSYDSSNNWNLWLLEYFLVDDDEQIRVSFKSGLVT